MSAKDPFTIFADELTLLRNDLKQLQRSSLNIDEAKTLNTLIAKSLKSFNTTAATFDDIVNRRLSLAQRHITAETTEAARIAAVGAIQSSHDEIMGAARIYAKNAGEARREVWRYFGGFWVWLVSICALGAVLGVLATIYLQGLLTASAFGQYPDFYCLSAGGEKGKLSDGRKYCVFYFK